MVRRRKHYDKDYITVGNTKLDIEGLEITNTDHSLRLSGKEVEILSLFMNNYEKKICNDGTCSNNDSIYDDRLWNKVR